MQTRPILPPTYFFIAAILMLLLHFLLPLFIILPAPWNWSACCWESPGYV